MKYIAAMTASSWDSSGYRRPRRRRNRFALWLLTTILASLYIVSLLGVFRLESQLRRRSSTVSDHDNPSESTLSTNEAEHRKRVLDFKHEQKQRNRLKGKLEILVPNFIDEDPQNGILESPRKNGLSDEDRMGNEVGIYYINPTEKNANKSHRQEVFAYKQPYISPSDGDDTGQRREKLQFKLDRIARTTGRAPNSDEAHNISLWELSDFIPSWMKEYFNWHKEKRRTLAEDMWHNGEKIEGNSTSNREENVNDTKFLVLQCLPAKLNPKESSSSSSLPSCGNLSERLASLPYWLRMAQETNRILFIHWTVPADLSHYLDPPVGGCDWRAPVWLKRMLEDNVQGILINDETSVLSNSSYLHSLESESLVRVQLKHSMEFEHRYNDLRNSRATKISSSPSSSSIGESATTKEPKYHQVIHDVWVIFFVPSLHIRKNIYATFRLNQGMETGRFTSIDLSATRVIKSSRRTEDDWDSALITEAKFVYELASRLRPKEPLLAVTDDLNVTRALQDLNGDRSDTSIFARYKSPSRWKKKSGISFRKELLPQLLVDFDVANSPRRLPESFHDIFVNFYLMAMGRCIFSYGSGTKNISFGRLASLIGYDSNCYYELNDVNFDSLTRMGGISNYSNSVFAPELYNNREKPKPIEHHFSRPMIGDGADEIVHINHQVTPKQHLQPHGEHVPIKMTKEGKLPRWMNEYLDWHRAAKRQLIRSNWNSSKYLILGCFESFTNCGGISDRLKPLPMLVWEAYQSQRILLIWWERPKPLEEWFIPPNYDDGGVDWTVPLFLKEELLRSQPRLLTGRDGYTACNFAQGKNLRRGAVRKNAIVYRIQSPDGGEKVFFDEQTQFSSSYQDVFHNLFRRFFTPNSRLSKILDSKMNQYNLVPGEYTAVHLRAMYGKRDDRDLQETVELAVLGVNCASNLYPGVPVFFASDTAFAVDSAQAYGKLHGLPIVSLDFQHEISSFNSTASINRSNPIHLDKDPGWKNRSASDYDPTFVDLYILAQSRCVAFSNGGYGTFGSLLSYDSECKMRFFKGNHKVKKCIWMNERRERQKLELPNTTDLMMGR